MNEPCILHRDDLSLCPSEHVCECGYRLSEHRSVATYCPKRNGSYIPNASTLTRFPWQYLGKVGND